MRIAIDIERATSKFKSGIQWYAYNLIHNLAKIDTENSYILYHFKSCNPGKEYERLKSELPQQRNFQIKITRVSGKLARICQARFLPIEFFIGDSDIIHIPNPIATPLTVKAKIISTIHDLVDIIPESEKWGIYDRRKKAKRQKSSRASILKSDRIITVSEYTKRDIMKYFSINPSKISVVHLGADTIFKPSEDSDEKKEILNKYRISKKYLLFVGDFKFRKNIAKLIQTFEKIKRHFDEYQFLIVGKKTGFYYKEVLEKLNKLPEYIKEDIILTEYVPLEDLPYLYSSATLCLYPSLYEGFGLPILEAMACGCPVLTSNISSMPEVAGDAAILVDPYSLEEIMSAIEKVLSDERLRVSLRQKGLERVKHFSWEKAARETLQVYRETCAGS